MTKTIYQPNYWHYLTGDFLNRVHPRFRKLLKILISVVIGARQQGHSCVILLLPDRINAAGQKEVTGGEKQKVPACEVCF